MAQKGGRLRILISVQRSAAVTVWVRDCSQRFLARSIPRALRPRALATDVCLGLPRGREERDGVRFLGLGVTASGLLSGW